MFERWKYKRKRKAEIQSLRDYIDKEFKEAADAAKTPQEKGEAEQFAYSSCQYEINKLDYLRQEDIIEKLKTAPFEVPQDYWYDGGWEYQKVLTSKGEAWARHELDKLWRAKVEFWAKLVLPVLALVISIIALVKKSR
jgi:lipopolysaccharide export LptBFGC system permease protein LptF